MRRVLTDHAPPIRQLTAIAPRGIARFMAASTTTGPSLDAAAALLPGILLMNAAVLVFSINDGLMKWLVPDYGLAQSIFLRGVFALLPILYLVHRMGGIGRLRTRRPIAHIWRGLLGCCALFGFFYSFAKLELADAYAITFAAPLMVTALSVPLLGERVGWRRWAAVIVGFLGVLVVVRPGGELFNLWGAICFAATFFYALLLISIRKLAETENTAAMTFYFASFIALAGGVGMLGSFEPPSAAAWLLFVGAGISGGVGQILMTEALRRAPPSVLAPFDYTALIWGIVIGWVVWRDLPSAWVLLGASLIIAAGLFIIWREHRLARARAAEA